MKPCFALVLAAVSATFALPASAGIYTTSLLGSNESPANASPATGYVKVTVDEAASTLLVDLMFSGLVGGNAAAAHIHCCTAAPGNVNVAVGFPGFPATMAGTYQHLFDLQDVSIYTASFVSNFGSGTAFGSRNALIAGLNAGTAYANIHDATFPGGEIRGFLAVPEPATAGLVLASLGALGLARRQRRPTAD